MGTLVSRVINEAREILLSNQIFLNLEFRTLTESTTGKHI